MTNVPRSPDPAKAPVHPPNPSARPSSLTRIAVEDLKDARMWIDDAIRTLETETKPKRARWVALRRIRTATLEIEAARVGLRKAGEASR